MDSQDAILGALEGRLLNTTEAHVKLLRSIVKEQAGKQSPEPWSPALIQQVEAALAQFHTQQISSVRGSLEELAKRASSGKVYPLEELDKLAGADMAEQMQRHVAPSLTKSASGKSGGSSPSQQSPRVPKSDPVSNGKAAAAAAARASDPVAVRIPPSIAEDDESVKQRITPTGHRKSLESFIRGGVEQSGAGVGAARRMRDGIRERDQLDLEAVKKVVPKSDSTRQRLGKILSQNFIFSDLEPALRDEIIDAFTDIRIAPGTEVIKQNDMGDNFYIVDVGEFEVLKQEGTNPPVVLKVKGPEESFGEIALLYDCPRNATVRALTHGLLWFVDRVTFKSIILRHLTESKPAQILREAPALHKLATRDVVNLSNQSKTETFARGECLIKSGSIMEKVYLIAEGQVRVTNGAPPRTGYRQTAVSNADTAAVLGRLAVLGESMLLSGEQISTFNYVAASDTVTAITIDRGQFDAHILGTVRRGLQLQLVIVALQRVPALSDLKDDQLQSLAESFTEQAFPCGSEVTRAGIALGSQARIYIVQSGRVSLASLNEWSSPTSGSSSPSTSPGPMLTRSKTSNSGWGSKLGGIFRGGESPKAVGGSAPGSPSGTAQGLPVTGAMSTGHAGNSPSRFKMTEQPFDEEESNSDDEDGADVAGEASEKLGALRRPLGMQPIKLSRTNTLPSPTGRAPITPSLQATRSLQTSKTNVTTYGCFGDEALLGGHAICSSTAVVESGDGSVVLSISLSELTAILGPIQEILMRATNLRLLRSVPCLDYLTEGEVESLATAMGVVRFAPGETIFKAGEPADRMYVVRKGTAQEIIAAVTGGRGARSSAEGRVYTKGGFFGESALIGPGVRKETVIAGVIEPRGFSESRSPVAALKESSGPRSGSSSPSGPGTIELYYLDRAVLEANLGPLEEVREQRRKEDELKGIVKAIKLEELEEIGLLGTGLFGKVKLVYNKRTGEHYALKCVSKTKVVRMQEEEHLRNEKLLMSELEHPFIAKLIRTFKDKDNVYLLQELTTGRELFLFMEKAGRLKEWEAAFYAGGVLLALEYMHSKGIVYRDLKPENTLIDESGYPKLIDMGFAKRLTAHRKTYSMCGTPDYMAPEIIRRQGHTKAVDYWALGCMIFEMVTNTSPFNRGDDPPQTVFQRITEGRLSFPSYMTPACVDIIRKLLDPNPDTRLGCGKNGAKDIKDHPFFAKEINFNLLIRMKEEAPMIPPKVENFNDLCIDEDVRMDEMDAPLAKVVDHSYWDDIF